MKKDIKQIERRINTFIFLVIALTICSFGLFAGFVHLLLNGAALTEYGFIGLQLLVNVLTFVNVVSVLHDLCVERMRIETETL